MLRLKNITKDYAVAGSKVHALRGITLNFRASEFVSVLGPSGCGKTTLLNIIGGLDKYTSGDLTINGRSTKEYRDRDWDVYRNHRIGFIFQSYNLIPQQSVIENVELALTIAGMGKDERREKAKRALEKVGLTDQANKRPNQLSGGQCQRVAIARALVNDPEILLADEPTGALDTKTSDQIMDLIKEIAKERLVIMVTHNPDIAEKYSTRIIKLLDGLVVGDSNPLTEAAELDEQLEYAKKSLDTRAKSANSRQPAQPMQGGGEKAKMGVFTAFMLSLKNLMSKKSRTFMTVFAGSIGIIGVAVVLAFSSGITNYISAMENDMLSGYPVSVTTNAIDFNSIMNLTNSLSDKTGEEAHLSDKVYVNRVVETLTKLASITITNNITQEYVDFVEKVNEEASGAVKAIRYNYGINYANNIYTEYSYDLEGKNKEEVSIAGVRNIFSSVLENIKEYKPYASMINSVGTFSELPDNEEYIRTQYDIVAGTYPKQGNKNSLVLVLSDDDKVDDLLLAQMGYVSQREFMNYTYLMVDEKGGGNEYFQSGIPHLASPFDYNKFVGEGAKKFTWYPNNSVFKNTGNATTSSFQYQTYKTDEFGGGVPLDVECILRPKSNVRYGALSSGMYHTKALTNYIVALETNVDTQSEIVKVALAKDGEEKYANNVRFSYHYYLDQDLNEDKIITENERDILQNINNKEFGSNASTGTSSTSDQLAMLSSMYTKEEFAEMIRSQFPAGTPGDVKFEALLALIVNSFYQNSEKIISLASLGGNSIPKGIYFYVNDFDSKESLTSYLDKWNDKDNGYITEDKDKITYTDTIGMIMTMINMLILIITTALVAFTSLALVVSTVMIAIITYVSVVERIKEIGVIRALGGRKRDVKNLFISETFMLGLGSGIIGVAITYLISLIVNILLAPMLGIAAIAALPWWQALIMVGVSVGLTLISGLSPASAAAKKDPVTALRTE